MRPRFTTKAALRVKPTAETHNGLGFVLSKQGKVDEAIAQFREAIRVNPKYTAAYNNLAGNLIREGKLDEAASYYRTSLSEKPSATLHNQLGLVLMRLGRADEAAQQFRKAARDESRVCGGAQESCGPCREFRALARVENHSRARWRGSLRRLHRLVALGTKVLRKWRTLNPGRSQVRSLRIDRRS